MFLYAIPCFPYTTVERHRKEKINAGINRIGELLPCSQALKQVNACNKSCVLLLFLRSSQSVIFCFSL